ncbi:hypothetical protein QBC40DRAFT_352514 [Triangularia verruculosa]|uniref:Uncharacterized protein n=1 Tax=Triangularia verruculosa TaxID=2587418 RepID=A0AAN7AQK4_9PEZI|nr:hypothetical protein QBC40DRAFT_352514 [Triangularia verruculosa]
MSSHHSRASSRSSGSRSSRGSPPPQLPPAPATYNDDQLEYLEKQNERNVTQPHLVYALDHVVQVLRARGIHYGVMGGMSMILLGNQGRTTRDVDLAVEVKVRDLLAAFVADTRTYIPRAAAVAGSGVARMFVLTGRSYGQNVSNLAVEMDLILNGQRGAPRTLQGAVNTHAVNTECGQRSYNILGLQYLFPAKLRALYEREGPNDYQDLVWMSSFHPQIVSGIAPQLDHNLRHYFACQYSETELDPNRVAWLYGLLGLSTPSSRSSSQGSRRSGSSGSRRVR